MTKANKRTVNPRKSFVIILPAKTTNQDIDVFLNNNLVSNNESVKYFGVTIDARLNFDKHIDILTKKNPYL